MPAIALTKSGRPYGFSHSRTIRFITIFENVCREGYRWLLHLREPSLGGPWSNPRQGFSSSLAEIGTARALAGAEVQAPRTGASTRGFVQSKQTGQSVTRGSVIFWSHKCTRLTMAFLAVPHVTWLCKRAICQTKSGVLALHHSFSQL